MYNTIWRGKNLYYHNVFYAIINIAVFFIYFFQENNYLPIDPHVLATPVLADLNNDYKVEELVIPVSYFYEEDDYRVAEKLQRLGGLKFSDIDKYLVAGITVMNLTTGETLWSKLLDLTQVLYSYNLKLDHIQCIYRNVLWMNAGLR